MQPYSYMWMMFCTAAVQRFSMRSFCQHVTSLEKTNHVISFLKKKITLVEGGLMVVPGTNTARVVENCVEYFGKVRAQTVPL